MLILPIDYFRRLLFAFVAMLFRLFTDAMLISPDAIIDAIFASSIFLRLLLYFSLLMPCFSFATLCCCCAMLRDMLPCSWRYADDDFALLLMLPRCRRFRRFDAHAASAICRATLPPLPYGDCFSYATYFRRRCRLLAR